MSRLLDLLTQLDRVRAQHRAGLVPPHGEVEALFDTAADVRSELATGKLRAHTVGPSTSADASPAPPARQGFLSVETVDAGGRVVSRARIPLEPLAAVVSDGR